MKKYMKKLKLILIIVFGLLSSNTSSGQQNVWQSVVKNVTPDLSTYFLNIS